MIVVSLGEDHQLHLPRQLWSVNRYICGWKCINDRNIQDMHLPSPPGNDSYSVWAHVMIWLESFWLSAGCNSSTLRAMKDAPCRLFDDGQLSERCQVDKRDFGFKNYLHVHRKRGESKLRSDTQPTELAMRAAEASQFLPWPEKPKMIIS